jgi:hypothetical protein
MAIRSASGAETPGEDVRYFLFTRSPGLDLHCWFAPTSDNVTEQTYASWAPESLGNLQSKILPGWIVPGADPELSKKELLLQRLREIEGVVKSKDAVIKSLLEQLQNPGVQISLKDAPRSISSADVHRTSPEERPIDKTIREWVEKAQASILSTAGYRLSDGRGVNESDSSSEFSGSLGKTLGSQMSPTKSSVSDSGHSTGRKGLTAPDTERIRSSPKLHSLPFETAPLGLLADLSLKDSKETNEKRSRSQSRSVNAADDGGSVNGHKSIGEADDENAVGIARGDYFQPTEQLGLRTIETERKDILEIMTSGLISPAEVDQLFKIFFDRLNVRDFVLISGRVR